MDLTFLKDALAKLVSESPMAAIAVLAIVIIYKMMEQKVAMAQKYGEECKANALRDVARIGSISEALERNSVALKESALASKEQATASAGLMQVVKVAIESMDRRDERGRPGAKR